MGKTRKRQVMVDIECFNRRGHFMGVVSLPPDSTAKDLKTEIFKCDKKLTGDRLSLRTHLKGKDLKDEALLMGSKIYIQDLGPQISWRFVFLSEYLGPLVIYLLLYFYHRDEIESVVPDIAAACWSLHYGKRILETIYVHRFSHSTMPIVNLFRNCVYYWGFAANIAYHVNDPTSHTAPHFLLIIFGLGLFAVSELGNLSIHLLLRDLRPPGSKIRKIPVPNKNPLTVLFNYVSCPNYTYEYGAWLGFSIMTCSFPALFFTVVGMYQMTVWALEKHKNYKEEFSNYPIQRKAILPGIL